MANSSFITLMKKNIKSELVNDPFIVKAIGSPDYNPDNLGLSGEDVGENYIFTWNQNPNTLTNTTTFITIQTHIKKHKDHWVRPTLEFWIYSHKNHIKLDSEQFPDISANRNDYLSQLLSDKFNGRTTFGMEDDNETIHLLNKLELKTNYEGVYNSDFVYRRMIFETKDINDSICDRW